MTPLDRDRLAKILGMLGSSHGGEASAAGRAAHALLRDAGMTWSEVLGLRGTGDAEEAVRGLHAENEVLQSRLNAYISENLALRDEIERLKAPIAQPKPRAHSVAQLLQSRPLPVIFVCAAAAVWAALLLELGPPEVLGPSLAALLLFGLFKLARWGSKPR